MTMCNIFYFFRPSSPDHNGNAGSGKAALFPSLPPWLAQTSNSPPSTQSQDEPKDLSPRSRHFSSNSSNGKKSFLTFHIIVIQLVLDVKI